MNKVSSRASNSRECPKKSVIFDTGHHLTSHLTDITRSFGKSKLSFIVWLAFIQPFNSYFSINRILDMLQDKINCFDIEKCKMDLLAAAG